MATKNLSKKTSTKKAEDNTVTVEESVAENVVEEAVDTAIEDNAPTETSEADFEPIVAEPAVKESATDGGVKTCKVKLSRDHNCTIGGETYFFKKNEVYVVPVNVKRVLKKGDLLRPLN